MNCRGVAAFDFATVYGCDQLFVSLTNAQGLTLYFLVTDVPDQVWFMVVAPIGNSDHSSHFNDTGCSKQTCVLVRMFSSNIKLIGIQLVVQYWICSFITFGLQTIPLRVEQSSVPAGY